MITKQSILLEAYKVVCKVVRDILVSRQDAECPFCRGTGEVCDTAGTTMDCEECLAYAIGRLDDVINKVE